MSDRRESDPALRLRLWARPDAIPLLRRQLRAWLKQAGTTGRELFEIQLAATEAFANAVEHPEQPSSDLVEIEGTITYRTVTISIRDSGQWQQGSAKEGGGLGLPIMDSLMDSVVIEPFQQGTTVTLRRQLAEADS